MSIFVEIDNLEVKTRSGVSAKSGKAYNLREQSAYLHNGKKYPTAFTIMLQDSQPPYPLGRYELDDSSFLVGGYGDLQIRPVLKLVQNSFSSSSVSSAAPVVK